jgi:type II secretory pathway pseudopilin PulG
MEGQCTSGRGLRTGASVNASSTANAADTSHAAFYAPTRPSSQAGAVKNGKVMRAWQQRHRRAKRHAGRSEDGFTLFELLIVIIILPIVVGGIAAALIAILQNESTSFNRVADSADAQITSVNFTRDVQSASVITTQFTAPGPGGGTCWPSSPSTPPSGSRPLLTLRWGQTIARAVTDAQVQANSTFTSAKANLTTADIGSTVTDTAGAFGSGGGLEITNVFPALNEAVVNGPTTAAPNDHVTIQTNQLWESTYWDVPVSVGPATTYDLVRQFCAEGALSHFLSTTIVAHDLPANQGNATITCGASIPAAACTSSYLASHPLSTAGITSVTLSADEPASGYQFNLSATPRNSTSSDTGVLTLLMTGSSPSNLAVSGPNDTLTIDGELAFNPSSGSIASGGPTDSIAVDPVPGQTPIVGYRCNSHCGQITSSFAGLQCSKLTCPTPASLNSNSTISYPVLGPPTNPGASGPVGSCSGTSPMTCTPGYYATAQTLVGGVVFSPGNYLFASSVTVNGAGSKVSFGAGDYTFDAGLDTSATATNTTLTGSGVFFYFANSAASCSTSPTCSFDVNAQGGSIQLAPASVGPYGGLLFYQPVTNSTSMILASPSTTSNLSGVIDAPGATISLGSGGDTFNVAGMVASGLTLGSSNVTATVGN